MEIKCVAIDDEPLALELMKDNINRIPFLKCEGLFNSANKAAEYFKNNKVDLAFLDIQMPGLTGLDLAMQMKDTMIVFTTAYDEFAVRGFDVAAVDYILKPIVFSRFEKACNKAREFHLLKNSSVKTDQSIVIRSEHRAIKVLLSNILYVEGLKDYVKIFTATDEKPILTRVNLKGFAEQLSDITFKRVHKSYIVNFMKVTEVGTDELFLGSIKIPLGDAYKSEVKALFSSGN